MIDRMTRLRPLLLVLVCWAWSSGLQAQDAYVQQWGPALGTPLPMLDALDQKGQRRQFADLTGEHGLLLFFNRSTDW